MVDILFSYEYNSGASFYEAEYVDEIGNIGIRLQRLGLRLASRTACDFVELLGDVYRDFKLYPPPKLKLTFYDGITHEQQALAKTVLDFSTGVKDKFIEDILGTDWDLTQQ